MIELKYIILLYHQIATWVPSWSVIPSYLLATCFLTAVSTPFFSFYGILYSATKIFVFSLYFSILAIKVLTHSRVVLSKMVSCNRHLVFF